MCSRGLSCQTLSEGTLLVASGELARSDSAAMTQNDSQNDSDVIDRIAVPRLDIVCLYQP